MQNNQLQGLLDDFKTAQYDKVSKYAEIDREILVLKKKQNLALLEHKLTERIDDSIKACIRTMADRFGTSKKFRLVEHQVKQMFELVLMLMQDDHDELKVVLSGIA